jgi:hypothetical protein
MARITIGQTPEGKQIRRHRVRKTKIEAARQYDEMAKEHYGEFARLNFPEAGGK